MKAILTSFVLLIVINISFAQGKLGDWRQAKVFLNDGTEKNVEILLDEQIYEGILITKAENKLKTYTSYQLSHFVIEGDNANRSFYSIPYKGDLDAKTRKLFLELLYNGEEISLLSQKYYVSEYAYETLILFDMESLQLLPYTKPTLLSPLTKNFEKAQEEVLVSMFGNSQVDMESYITSKRLKLSKKEDVILALEYYHELP